MIKQLPANRQGLLSIVTGIALCRMLRRDTGAEVWLKWPNDLLLDGCKLGGILIEAQPRAAGGFFYAIGFGVNVFMPGDELAAIEQPATSLQQAAAQPVDRSALLAAAIDTVVEAIRAFAPEASEAVIDEFARFDAFHGEPIELLLADEVVRGINRGIDHSGQLKLETEGGIELHAAAEVSLRSDT